MLKLIFITIFSFLSFCAVSQSIFKPLSKPGRTAYGKLGVSADSTMNAIRAIANVASYAVPSNLLLSGGGISYQHLRFNRAEDKWECLWSINSLAWITAGYNDPSLVSYGMALGLLNNLVLVGVAVNKQNVMGTLGIGISLNN